MTTSLANIETPAAVIDVARMQRNVARMQDRMNALGVSFRPHVKTTKSVAVADRQRAAGANGITVSTLREAEEFFAAGYDDILYAVCIAPHRLGRVSRELDYMRGAASFVTSPTVSVVTLWGPRGTPRAHAKVAYDRTSGRFILLSSRLEPPPEGTRYQLWVIADGVQAASARLPESRDGVLRTLPRGDELFFFALSIEPLGGVDEPTGPMVLMSRPLRDDP